MANTATPSKRLRIRWPITWSDRPALPRALLSIAANLWTHSCPLIAEGQRGRENHTCKIRNDVIRGTKYRVYMVGRDGRFLGPAKELECTDDEAIVAKAMRMGSGVDLEIWDDTRLVVRLPGMPAPREWE